MNYVEQNSASQPASFGSFYKGPNDSFVEQGANSQQQQYTPLPQSLRMDQNSSPQTALSQLNSPKPFTGAGSADYGTSQKPQKTQNYQSFMDMMSAQKNKYIGASLSSEPRNNAVAANTPKSSNMPQSVQSTIDASKQGAGFEGSGMTAGEGNTAGKSGGFDFGSAYKTFQGIADSVSKSQQNLARTQYEGDVSEWQQKGKYWFDVNSNLKPDLEKYMSGMPSSLESLQEGSWVTSLQDGNTDTAGEYLSSILINPAGGKTGNDTADAILNPLNILEQQGWVDKGYVNYIGGKASEGAMSGGGFSGALIGIVDGIFSWDSAKQEDADRTRKAREEYERKLEEWTYNTNKRLLDARVKRDQEIEASNTANRDKRKAEAKEKNTQKISDITGARSSMATALLNAGSVKSKNRSARAARWGR